MTLTWYTGTLASAKASISGTKTPWSNPRCTGALSTGMLAPWSRVTVFSISAAGGTGGLYLYW
jgi:hypothetical protein